jgi:hypothetical protein
VTNGLERLLADFLALDVHFAPKKQYISETGYSRPMGRDEVGAACTLRGHRRAVAVQAAMAKRIRQRLGFTGLF